MTKMIRYGIRKKVEVKQQEEVKEKVKYFRCWGVKHKKWKYPNIRVEREKRKR